MKIGVISDTHIPAQATALPEHLGRLFSGVDKIIHAGDIESIQVLDELELIAPVHAVAGNMDHGIYGLPVKRSMMIEGMRVGVMHGAGGPKHNIRPFVRKHLGDMDIIIYGHTHQAFWGQEGGIWFMNPGSPTGGPGNAFPSVGLLTITTNNLKGELIRL